MKFLKGCLITLIIFVGICIIGWLFFQNSAKENLNSLSGNVKQNWEKYKETLKERNAEFTREETKSDSLKYYLENSNKFISSTECSTEFELNEYKLNKIAMSDSLNSNLNEKLNLNLDSYNNAVREYNIYRVRFPNSIIARKEKFTRFYEYFDIRYGVDNEKVIIRKKETENWIKNGGPRP